MSNMNMCGNGLHTHIGNSFTGSINCLPLALGSSSVSSHCLVWFMHMNAHMCVLLHVTCGSNSLYTS